MNQISATDWINANGVVIQVAVAIAVPVIQGILNRKRDMSTPIDTKPLPLATSSKIWFLKNAWGALLGIPLSVWLMHWQASQPGPPTREFVGVMVFLGLYLAFSVIGVIGFVLAAAGRPLYARVAALAEKIESNQ